MNGRGGEEMVDERKRRGGWMSRGGGRVWGEKGREGVGRGGKGRVWMNRSGREGRGGWMN